MKPYTPADPTPEEEARMKELRQQCIIESYGPDEINLDFTSPYGGGFAVYTVYGDLSGYGCHFTTRGNETNITHEVIAAARARLMLSLVELDILERGIKAMEG